MRACYNDSNKFYFFQRRRRKQKMNLSILMNLNVFFAFFSFFLVFLLSIIHIIMISCFLMIVFTTLSKRINFVRKQQQIKLEIYTKQNKKAFHNHEYENGNFSTRKKRTFFISFFSLFHK